MSKPTRIFDARNRARLAREYPQTPTGVIFTWGGVEFNLMPLTFRALLGASEILDQGQDIIARLKQSQLALAAGQGADNAIDVITEIVGFAARELPELVTLVRDHLAKSPGICNAGSDAENAEDRARYEQWFFEQDAPGMVRSLLPLMREVVANRPLATPTPDASAAELSLEKTT